MHFQDTPKNNFKILIKLGIVTEKSVRLYNKITSCIETESLYDFLNHVKDNRKKLLKLKVSRSKVWQVVP